MKTEPIAPFPDPVNRAGFTCTRDLRRPASRLSQTLVPLLCLALASCTQPFRFDQVVNVPIDDARHASVLGAQQSDNSLDRVSAVIPDLRNRHDAQSVSKARLSREIDRSIRGALLYLDDTQIRDRVGLHSSLYDYCGPQSDSCEGVQLFNKRDGSGYIERKGYRVWNRKGEWASTIHYLPDRLGDAEGETKNPVQDSNAFVTTGILFPLYLIDETALPAGERLATRMRTQAVAGLADYKRGDAYSFWAEIAGETSSAPRTGPLNIPIHEVRRIAVLLSYPLYPIIKVYTVGMDVNVETWIRQVLNRRKNPYGFDSAFNIPNDADDTAMVVAIQKLHSLLQPQDNIKPDLSALKVLTRFRDLGRVKHERRNARIGITETGAFLTWLKDENLDVFSAPEKGIIPLGVNNVDCVVNANALFSLALNGAHKWAGFEDARKMLVTIVSARAWTDVCDLYYPQSMMLPYALTRAFREGRLFDDPAMRKSMGIVLRDLLEMQENGGAFPGGKDKTLHLSTALATNALLNIGGVIAHDENLFDEYQSAVAKAIRFLLSGRRHHQLMFSGNSKSGPDNSVRNSGFKWDSGLFFAGTYGDLAQWRSEAYTTAIVLEALVKFVLAYDLNNSTLLHGRRYQIESYGTHDREHSN
jgi:hypothetical protein